MTSTARRAALGIVTLMLVGFAAAPIPDAPLVVNTTKDTADADIADGRCLDRKKQCSLRAALEIANATPGFSKIHFSIPVTDPGVDPTGTMATIKVNSPLPVVTQPVIVDGSTDPRYSTSQEPVVTVRAIGRALSAPLFNITAADSSLSDLVLTGGEPALLITADHVTGRRLTIGNADGSGIQLLNADHALIADSWIGVDWLGEEKSNDGTGITIDKLSSNNTIVNNVIGTNDGAGIGVEPNAGIGNTLISNVIFENDGLAIDLGRDGVTANDKSDDDTGPNDLLNYPLITSAISSATESRIRLELPPRPGHYHVELFGTEAPDRTGHGELDMFLADAVVTVNEAGQSLSVTGPVVTNADMYVTATATECDDALCSGYGSTSEAGPVRPIEINHAPEVVFVDLSSEVGEQILVTLQGSDPEGQPLGWSVTGLPPGIVHSDAILVGTIDEDGAGKTFTVAVTATDEAGNTTVGSFVWAVTEPGGTSTTTTSTTSSTIPSTTAATSTTTSSTRPSSSMATTTVIPTTTTTRRKTTTTAVSTTPTTATTRPSTTPPTTAASTTSTSSASTSSTTASTTPTSTSSTTASTTSTPSTTSTSAAPSTAPPTTATPTTAASTTSPTTSAAAPVSSSSGDSGPPDELAAVDRQTELIEASLHIAAVELLGRAPSDVTARSSEASDTKPGLQVLLAGLAEMVRSTRPPIWPLVVAFVTSCLLWLIFRFHTERMAYMVRPDSRSVVVDGYGLRPGSGPFWGRPRLTESSTVGLETPFGVDYVDAGSLIKLDAQLSGPDHFR